MDYNPRMPFDRPQDAYPDPEARAKGLIREALIPALLAKFATAQLEPEETVYRKPSVRVSGLDEVRAIFEYAFQNEHLPLNYCRDMTVIDWTDHMEVVYLLSNMPLGGDLYLRVDLSGQDRDHLHMPSMTDLWRGANFMEREAYDMYGVRFEGHPNLKRLLLQDEYIGFPLRKDYPWKGRVEDMDAIGAVLPRGWRDMLLAEEEREGKKNAPAVAAPAATATATATAPGGEDWAVKPAGPVKDLDMAERIRRAKALSEARRKEKGG